MAKRPQRYEEPTQETEEETVRPERAPARRRIQVRAPEEMHGLSVQVLIPNEYLPFLLESYLRGAKDGSVSRRGRKLPEAVMLRQLVVRGLAELAELDEETVAEAMAEAERNEALSIAEHKERHGL
jgi:hypothetical protein